MPRNQLTPAAVRALLAQVKPQARFGKLTIQTITTTNRPGMHDRYHVVSRCDCGRLKTGFVREYLDALRLGRSLACRSCFASASVGRQWAVRKTETSPAVRSLAKRMFLRHRRAAKALGIAPGDWPEDEQPEIAERWQEFIPDAAEELAQIGRQVKTNDRRNSRQFMEATQ